MAATTRKIAMNPAGIAPPIRPYYSNCVKIAAGSSLLFLSGQVGMDERGRVVGADAASQTRQAIENLRVMLAANGATLDDVVRVTVYVTDMRHFDEIAAVRLQAFPENGPSSTIVEVRALALPGLLVEIDAVAVLPAQPSRPSGKRPTTRPARPTLARPAKRTTMSGSRRRSRR
jgi:enamine deaminase RidA (YjgF/YER057c/UK114 family)